MGHASASQSWGLRCHSHASSCPACYLKHELDMPHKRAGKPQVQGGARGACSLTPQVAMRPFWLTHITTRCIMPCPAQPARSCCADASAPPAHPPRPAFSPQPASYKPCRPCPSLPRPTLRSSSFTSSFLASSMGVRPSMSCRAGGGAGGGYELRQACTRPARGGSKAQTAQRVGKRAL